MNRVGTIVWKEWRLAVDTPMGYVIATAFLLAAGFFFGNSLFLIGQAEMRGYFSIMPLLLMFFVPGMSMRMLAEELRIGTFELLATLPVKTVHIVFGKYLAILLQVAVLLALTLVYPVTLSWLGNVDGGQIAASYIGALLLGSAYAAICLFASSLSRNAVVAYVIGFALLLALFLLQQAVPLFPPAVQDALGMLSPIEHYQLMLRGVISLDDIVCLLVTSGVFIAFTVFQLERRRWA